MKRVQPKTFLVGVTQPDWQGLHDYLRYTDQFQFFDSAFQFATVGGISKDYDNFVPPRNPLCLVSFYAKLCYKSLVSGKNDNVTKIRDIEDNLLGVIASGHGSVFEHVWLNFVTTDCSRVFTHELVRHRVGTAFSQTSGRYVSISEVDIVLPPELDPALMVDGQTADEVESILFDHNLSITGYLQRLRNALVKPDASFEEKKRITSAIRRLAPNGQTNEIGWSVNVRALRHLIELRTSRHAEWEIRLVFNEVAQMILNRWPMMMHGHKAENINGLVEYTGLHI